MQNTVKTPIPAIIKRNKVLLTIVQALFAGVFRSVMVIAALGIFFFTHSATLGGLASAVAVGGRVIVAYGTGNLMDRHGRKGVIALGGVVLGAGSFIMPLTSDYWIITLGVFRIGLGWSATNVASTALLCDLTPGPKRGSILWANDVVTGGTSVSLPAIGGAILSSLGFVAFGIAGVLISLPMVLGAIPIRETVPQSRKKDKNQ